MFLFGKIWRVLFFLKHPSWDSPFCLITDDFWQNKVISSCCECYGHNLGNEYFGDFFFFFCFLEKMSCLRYANTVIFYSSTLFDFWLFIIGKVSNYHKWHCRVATKSGKSKKWKMDDEKASENHWIKRPNPGQSEKTKSNFYFHTSLWCLKGLHESFRGTTKKCENKNLTQFLFQYSFQKWTGL